LFDFALRRSELARVQFKHMRLGDKELTVFGKGGTVKRRPFRWEETRLALERHILERDPQPDDYLLYPEKHGRVGSYPNYRSERIWEDRHRPLGRNGIRGWWLRCEQNAGVPHRRQHDARHTAGTQVLRQTGNLELTRIYMRHKHIASTARYMHLTEHDDLAAVFKRLENRHFRKMRISRSFPHPR
jgi:integrase